MGMCEVGEEGGISGPTPDPGHHCSCQQPKACVLQRQGSMPDKASLVGRWLLLTRQTSLFFFFFPLVF